MRHLFTVLLILITVPSGFAQEQQSHGARGKHSPYAGMESRQIKSLSDDEIADLQAGRGMSFALAAELNGYPGPRHVLELAGELAIDATQRATIEALLTEMQADAMVLGERLIAAEAKLDRSFAEGTATPQSVVHDTALAAGVRGSLRASHLRFHLRTLEVLTPDQIATYRHLRGYTGK